MTTTTTTTKRAAGKATAEAKAKAKAEASVTAAAEALMAEATPVQRWHLAAAVTVGTVAEHLAAANDAAMFVAEAEASAFRATAAARQAIGARMFRAHLAKLAEADTNDVPEAKAVTFTTLMASIVGCDEAGWKAKAAAKRDTRPIHRGWSTLKEDYSVFVNTSSDLWMDGYLASVGEGTPTVRGYLAFAKTAEANAVKADEAAAESGESSQARSARTRKAEAARQAEAAAEATRKRDEAKAEATRKAEADALARVNHVRGHLAANAVTGMDTPNAVLAAATATQLRDLAATCLALAEAKEAEAKAEAEAAKAAGKATPSVAGIVADGQAKANEAAAKHDTADDVAALGQVAEANEADELAEYNAFKAFKAMRAAEADGLAGYTA